MARLRDLLLTAALLLVLALIVHRLDDAPVQVVSGTVRVIDGDTVAFQAERVRLFGIDAPELHQSCERDGKPWPCGQEAKAYLVSVLGEGIPACEASDRDRYGRLLAICKNDDRDLNAAMVAAGYAVAFGGYEAEEAAARSAKKGLWAGRFDQPKQWRQSHGGMDEPLHLSGSPWRTWLRWMGEAIASMWKRMDDAWNG